MEKKINIGILAGRVNDEDTKEETDIQGETVDNVMGSIVNRRSADNARHRRMRKDRENREGTKDN